MTDQTIDVVIYEKDNCYGCLMTKKMLDRLGVDFWTVNIEHDKGAYERVSSWGFLQAPVVEVYDKVNNTVHRWSGFNPGNIKALKS